MTRQGSDSWIIVNGWERHQHYGDNRNIVWIKNYTDLIHRAEYLELTATARALLHGVWLLYARSGGALRTLTARSALGLDARSTHWKELSDAGFIQLVASKPLADARARARSREKEKDLPKKVSKQKTTGWREVRGSHGITHVQDPDGTDTPPIGRPL